MAKCLKLFVAAGFAMILTALMGALAVFGPWLKVQTEKQGEKSFSSLWKTWVKDMESGKTIREENIDFDRIKSQTVGAGFIPDESMTTTDGEPKNREGQTNAEWEAMMHKRRHVWPKNIVVLRWMSSMTVLFGFFSALALFIAAHKRSACLLCLAIILQVLALGTSSAGIVMGEVLRQDTMKAIPDLEDVQNDVAGFIGIVLAGSFSLISLLSCTLPGSVMGVDRRVFGGGDGGKIGNLQGNRWPAAAEPVSYSGYGRSSPAGPGAGRFNNLQEGNLPGNRWPAAPVSVAVPVGYGGYGGFAQSCPAGTGAGRFNNVQEGNVQGNRWPAAPVSVPMPVSYSQECGPPPSLAPPTGGFVLPRPPPVTLAVASPQPGRSC